VQDVFWGDSRVSTSLFASEIVKKSLAYAFYLGGDAKERDAMTGCLDHQEGRYMMRHKEGKNAL
jgi:hypothetical protein